MANPLLKTLVLLLALTISLVVATTPPLQSRQLNDLGLPACASQCLTKLLPSSGCSETDTECLCSAQGFQHDSAVCVQANCTVLEVLETKRIQDTTICPRPARDSSGMTERINWSLFGLAAAAVIARLFSRLPVLGGSGFGPDDYTIALSLALVTALDAVLHLMTTHGLGRDIWLLTPANVTTVLYYFWIEEFLYTFILAITKISILLLYLRMWPDTESQKFRNACYVLIVLLVLYGITMNTVLAVGCQPVSYSWTRWDGLHSGTCINLQGQIFATATLNILFDLLVFLFPIPKLVKLSFSSRRKKITLCLTFLVGLVVTICSIVRLQYLTVWGKDTNVTWGYNPIAIWSNIECNLSVICACVPALAGLAQRLWSKAFGSSVFTYSHGSAGYDGDYELRVRSASFSEWNRSKEPKRMYEYDSESENGDAKQLPAQWSGTKPLPREIGEDEQQPSRHLPAHLPAQWGATKPLPPEA